MLFHETEANVSTTSTVKHLCLYLVKEMYIITVLYDKNG